MLSTLSLQAALWAQHSSAVVGSPDRYFSVKDSIEMSRFDTSDGGPWFSPNKRLVSVVTSRGILETDSIESTLWVFRTAELTRLLHSQDPTWVPHLRPIVRVARVPRNSYTIFYAPVISSVRWTEDSKSLLYLGQSSREQRKLYRVDVDSGVVHSLTPNGYDVSLYNVRGSTIAYLAAPEEQSIPLGRSINADAFDMTGEPLARFMPQVDESALDRELWVLRKGKVWRLTKDGRQPIHFANHFPEVLSISPDANSVVVLQPSESIPLSWNEYVPALPYLKLRREDASTAGRFNFETPLQYAVYDLNTGKSRFMLKAPHANAMGYFQENRAVWENGSGKLLLTNTFLPLDGVAEEEQSRPRLPCACAVVDLKLNAASCAVLGRYDQFTRLTSAKFGRNSDEVIARFSSASNETVDQTYRRNGSVWAPVATLDHATKDAGESNGHRDPKKHTITIEIKESPDVPPALYASEQSSGRTRKFWDPNPGLSSIKFGHVTEFHWTDRTGYDWGGQLVRPPDYVAGRRYPLVIQTYGFSPGFVSDGLFPTASAVRPLAAVGIMVLQMPRRTDHYGTSREAPDQAIGFEAAIDRLDKEGLIDPGKVGIVGFSHTCYHVESALVSNPKRFAAATIADGFDGGYLQYLYSIGDPAANLLEQIYGASPFGAGLRIWMDQAPGFNLYKIEAPLRIEAIGFASAMTEWETYASLFGQGKPVDLVYFPLGDHLLQKPLERLASQQGNVDWFRFWLKGEEDPDPSKRQQYASWRRMREQPITRNEDQ